MRPFVLFAAALLFACALPGSQARAAAGDHPHLDRGGPAYSGDVYVGRRGVRGHRPRGRHHSRRGRYFYYGVPGVYFAPRYTYPRKRVRRSRNACSYWSRRCIANWGYGNANYRGCMRYHRCY